MTSVTETTSDLQQHQKHSDIGTVEPAETIILVGSSFHSQLVLLQNQTLT